MILLMVVGAGGWAWTAKLSGAIISPGFVVVERNVKKVQHLDGGIVAEITVEEGARVSEGQILIRLDSTLIRAELSVIVSQLVELEGRWTRLAAERDGAAELTFPTGFGAMAPGAENVRAGEIRLFNENRHARRSQREQLEERIKQLDEEIQGLTVQLASKRGELKIISMELKQTRHLHHLKLTTVTRVYALEREEMKLRGEEGHLIAQAARAKGQISEIQVQIATAEQTMRADAQKEIRAIEARVGELNERRIAAEDRLGRMEIRSPQTGFVHELAVHTVGGIVTPAAPIMMIVPEKEKRSIEVRIAPVDIDQVAVGQQARLRFTAFNQRTTPEVGATVTRVAANVSQDVKTGASYYSAHLNLDGAAVQALGDLKLVPGMPLEAFIATGERSAISYLVKPLTDQFARAFKEE